MGFILGLIIFFILIAIFSTYMKSDGQSSRVYCAPMYYYDDEDDFDSFESYQEEPEAQATSEEPMLYGGLPYGDGMMYFEDDGDAYL